MSLPARIILAARLVLTLLWRLVHSAAATAWIIIAGERSQRGTIALVRYEGLSETGAAVLASTIAVSPGSTPVDIIHERGEMWVHFLEAEKVEAAIAAIHTQLELPLRKLFPAHGGTRG